MAIVKFANLQNLKLPRAVDFVLIIIMIQEKFVVCCALRVIEELDYCKMTLTLY